MITIHIRETVVRIFEARRVSSYTPVALIKFRGPIPRAADGESPLSASFDSFNPKLHLGATRNISIRRYFLYNAVYNAVHVWPARYRVSRPVYVMWEPSSHACVGAFRDRILYDERFWCHAALVLGNIFLFFVK